MRVEKDGSGKRERLEITIFAKNGNHGEQIEYEIRHICVGSRRRRRIRVIEVGAKDLSTELDGAVRAGRHRVDGGGGGGGGGGHDLS